MGVGRLLRRAGFGISAIFLGFFGLFAVGETLGDPGGWRGMGLVAAWLVPFAAAVLLVRYSARTATRALAVIVVVVLCVMAWAAADTAAWGSFENQHGPVRAIALAAVAGVLAVLGLKRTGVAGALLLLLGLGSVLVAGTAGRGLTSLAAASTAPVITGVLYLASAALTRRPRAPDVPVIRDRTSLAA